MASLLMQQRRLPLGNRTLQNPSNPTPAAKQSRIVSGSKRARSPDHAEQQTHPTLKRVRASADMASSPTKVRELERARIEEKAQRIAEREQKAAEFKRKFTNAFPSWTFYIDSETIDHKTEQTFKTRILLLGGLVDDFFSSSATHFITDRPIPKTKPEDKENKGGLMSPIKLRSGTENSAGNLVIKALEYDMRIWNSAKLDSVLDRCLTDTTVRIPSALRHGGPSAGPQRSLSRLLQTEKIHGTTERDPTQKRHDWRYFSRGSVFVLVEDINQELATIAAHEYPIVKDKNAKKPWPVLYCHPQARNPFAPFDEKERKRFQKQQKLEQDEEMERAQLKKEKVLQTFKRKQEAAQTLKAAGKAEAGGPNLRKSVSMRSLRRQLSVPAAGQHGGCVDLDADDDDIESANASGYNASGAGMNYIAASGNSVGITSNTGTTSTSGRFQRNLNGASTLIDKVGRHVITSLKVSGKEKVEAGPANTQMGPPVKVPFLRKSKSTNTMKLPKREEGAKPGYCESCRAKFDDFATHTVSSKHRKFATNPANFLALDMVLQRLGRRTHQETEQLEAQRIMRRRLICSQNHFMGSPVFQSRELYSP